MYFSKDSGAAEPIGERVVTKMVDLIERNSSLSNHRMYFDNFFISYRLLTALRDRGIWATGTIRENRTNGAHKVLMTSSEMKKKERGCYNTVCGGAVCVVS
jgi:Transposase IS4